MTDRHAVNPDSPREISCPQQGRCDVRLQREWRVRCQLEFNPGRIRPSPRISQQLDNAVRTATPLTCGEST